MQLMISLVPIPARTSTFLQVTLEALTNNDMACPNSTTNIHNSSVYAGGAAQIQHVNAINGKSCPNSTTNIHDSSGYTKCAAHQIPCVNTIDDKSHPNLTTNIHDSSGYTGGDTAKIPQMQNQITTCLKIYYQD